MNEPNEVRRVKREVIEQRLLASLVDDGKVAIVLSEDELSELIEIIREVRYLPSSPWAAHSRIWVADLQQLLQESFRGG